MDDKGFLYEKPMAKGRFSTHPPLTVLLAMHTVCKMTDNIMGREFDHG